MKKPAAKCVPLFLSNYCDFLTHSLLLERRQKVLLASSRRQSPRSLRNRLQIPPRHRFRQVRCEKPSCNACSLSQRSSFFTGQRKNLRYQSLRSRHRLPANRRTGRDQILSALQEVRASVPSKQCLPPSQSFIADDDNLAKSPNQRRKNYQQNAVGHQENLVKSIAKELYLLPTDTECKFDLDDLVLFPWVKFLLSLRCSFPPFLFSKAEDNCNTKLKSVRIGFFGDCGVGKGPFFLF